MPMTAKSLPREEDAAGRRPPAAGHAAVVTYRSGPVQGPYREPRDSPARNCAPGGWSFRLRASADLYPAKLAEQA